MNTSRVLERLKPLRFIGIDFFLTKYLRIMVSRKVTIRTFWKRKASGKWKLEKDLFLGHLQSP